MTLLPAIRDEIVEAAVRQAAAAPRRRRWRRPSRMVLFSMVAAATVAGTAGGVALLSGVGGPPNNAYRDLPGERASGFARSSAPVVLGEFRLDGLSGPVQLIGYTAQGPGGRQVCLDRGMPDGMTIGACAPAVPVRPGDLMGLTGASDDTPRLASGATRSRVARVTISYRNARAEGSTQATLTRVPTTLAGAVGSPAFTYFTAQLPPRAKSVIATGFDENEKELWSIAFPGQ